MKKNLIAVLFMILLSTSLLGKPIQPSPYFVHDMEVYFWEMFGKTMMIDAPAKVSVQGIFNPSYYNADLFAEGTFGLEDGDKKKPLSQLRKEKSLFTWMTGYAFQAQSDGQPGNTFPKSNQNIGDDFIIGLSFYHANFLVRGAFVLGAYALKDKYYNGVSMVSASHYFNYDVSHYQSGSGYDRLSNPDGTYNRVFFEVESSFDFVVIKLLNSMNIEKPGNPAFSYLSTQFNGFNGYYSFTPYFALTNDVNGIYDFQVKQAGLMQRIFISKPKQSAFDSTYINLNANYSFYKETPLTKGKEIFFIEADLVFGLWGMSASYNNDTQQMGMGLALLMNLEAAGDIWIRLKYNPYSASPVYLRNFTDHGWNFEMGYRVSFYSLFSD